MKKTFKIGLGVLVAINAMSWNVRADDYPTGGQDTIYHASPVAMTLMLNNSRDSTLQLINNHAYRLRFSNASSSFHIMPGDGTDNEFKVSGGFPGGDLRTIHNLDGSRFGNPGIMLDVSTTQQVLNTGPIQTQTNSCTYVCGTQTVCQDVPQQVCHTENRQVCRDIPEQVCRTDNRGNRICQTVYHRECHNEPQTICQTVYHRECHQEAQYCNGYETWEVQTVTTGTVYQAGFSDSSTRQMIGAFDGTYDVNTQTNRIRIIDTTCR